jgi:hypothetical protein
MRFQTNRRCPHCGSGNVRRSGRLDSEARAYLFHSPYRCRDCEQRFWVVSRKALYGVGAGCAVFALGVIIWSGMMLIGLRDPPAPSLPAAAAFELKSEVTPPSDARVLGGTLLRQWGTRIDAGTPDQQ